MWGPSCSVDRRDFLGGCVSGAAGWACLPALGAHAAPSETGDKPTIQLVFVHPDNDRPIWPNIGYDFETPKEHISLCLRYACSGVRFAPVTVKGAADARALVERNKTEKVDGYLVYILGITWQRPARILAETGLPVLMVDHLFAGSGSFLIDFAANRRKGHKVEYVSSSDFEDVIAAAKCFALLNAPGKTADDFLAACARTRRERTKRADVLGCTTDELGPVDFERGLDRLKQARILVVSNYPEKRDESTDPVFGTKVRPIDFAELRKAYDGVDSEQAGIWGQRWAEDAERVFEPTEDELRRSGTAYLAMTALMKKHDAQAIAVNCLGGFYGGHLPAYPCLGFCQLNNDGLVGACEADVRSALTMLVMSTLTGRPGFISDPVIDTSRNRIIYAHCVAPYKAFGPGGPSNPYHIMSHSEDRKGASLRSLLPLGYMTTTLEINTGSRQVIFHQGKSVENVDLDRACRTKLAVEVKGDIDKLMNYWDQWGWHRVTFYGDLKPVVQQLCDRCGLTLVEEA